VAVSPTLLVAAAPAALMGAGIGVGFVVGYTILQRRVDDDIRGRTFAAFSSGVRVAIFAATVAVPFAIGILGRESRVPVERADGTVTLLYPYVFGGIRLTLLATGALAAVGALASWRSLLRSLQQELAPIEGEDGRAIVRGAFIVFEGGDGSGKSTQIALLRAALEARGHRVLVTREPGGTAIGEEVREVLLRPESVAMTARTEALLYAAARAQHVEEVIGPALAAGTVVLCDRFIDSSIVYQGAGRGLGESAVESINRWATAGLRPDLTVLLDVDVDEGLSRAASDSAHDRLEAAGPEFHRTVRDAYRRRASIDAARVLVLDGSRPVEELARSIDHAVVERVGLPVVGARPSGSRTAAAPR